MIVSDDTSVMLVVEPFFQSFVEPQEIADTSKSREVIVGLSAESKEQVDDLTEKALAAGGQALGEPQDDGFHVHAGLPRPRRASVVVHPHGHVRDPDGMTEQQESESAIRALIERWATAVHAGDLETVLADHADDIQMFDVPPPNEVRGIEAYRETWPPFFERQRRGASFEIVSLDVTAGADVAFATALLRCGTEEELRQDPDNRSAPDRRAAQGGRSLDRLARASFLPRTRLRNVEWPS